LLAARRLVELRQRAGKAAAPQARHKAVSPDKLVRAFEEDSARKRLMVKRTQATRSRLMFITEALRQLAKDDTFMALLEDEGLTTMPARIASRVAHLPVAEA
jgi:ParB family transcriptional regulator, chromosome partitioning protein